MEQIIKQVVGIDVGSKELVVCIGRIDQTLKKEVYIYRPFPNTVKGFRVLRQWVSKATDSNASLWYVMEATGVYHEALAYYLDHEGCDVSIILPNKISNYFKTLDVKTVTDKTSSEAIALFGLERSLEKWSRPAPVYKQLRQITRERDQLILERSVIKNQLHAEKAEAEPNSNSIKRAQHRIKILNQQVASIMAEIEQIVEQNAALKEHVKTLTSIPGVGLLTCATILAETNGFDMIRNKRQLVSFAGLDVKEKQSGISIKGKPMISKRGNKHLRKALHLPALAAIRYDKYYKGTFARLVSRHGIKMKAVVAVQRKILELTYILFKTGRKYDAQYSLIANGTDTQNLEQLNSCSNQACIEQP